MYFMTSVTEMSQIIYAAYDSEHDRYVTNFVKEMKTIYLMRLVAETRSYAYQWQQINNTRKK